MTSWPKISVITPSYNQGEYLETCLCSVLEQGYPNLEYLVLDGGSQDDSPRIIQRYGDQLAYWVSEPDQGQADAINKGLQRASGELLAWLNADDYYLPGALEKAALAYRQHSGAPFFFGNGVRVEATGKVKTEFFPEGRLIFNREALIYGLNYILQPATFIAAWAVTKVGMLDTSLHYGLDTDLWIRLSALGEPQPIPEILAATREYGATKTSTGSFGRLEELRHIAEKYSGEPVTPGYLCYYLDTLTNYVQAHPDQFPPGYREHVLALWGATSSSLAHYGARPDGYPFSTGPGQPDQQVSPPSQVSLVTKLKHRSRRLFTRRSPRR
jgi:glycosyltransferase involved in cell wall biosynthesis